MRDRNRRDFEAYGEVFFITSTVAGFINVFNDKRACDIFADCLKFYQEREDLILLAWVLMPNHFHLIAKCGIGKNISSVIGNIKRYTARQIGQYLADSGMTHFLDLIGLAAQKEPGKGTALWKPRFDSFVITSEDTLRQKMNYIHDNPVRRGFVDEPWQWRYSSASDYAGKSGIGLPVDSAWHCIGY